MVEHFFKDYYMISLKNVQYITDENGNEKVVLDYKDYKRILEVIEDIGLLNAMKEAEKGEYVDEKDFFDFLEQKINESED